MYEKGIIYIEFADIEPYRTNPDEINKNAIVERMIKTLKQYVLNIFMSYKVVQLNNMYLKYSQKYIANYKIDISFTDYLLEFACLQIL
jgi:hypothetical protein